MNPNAFLPSFGSIKSQQTPLVNGSDALQEWDRDAGERLPQWQELALQNRLKQYAAHPYFQKIGLDRTMSPRQFIERCPVLTAAETQAVFLDPHFSQHWVTQGAIDVFALSSGTTAARRKIFPVTSESLQSFERYRNLYQAIAPGFIADADSLSLPTLMVTASRGQEEYQGIPIMPMTWYMTVGKGFTPPEGPLLHYGRLFNPDFSLKPGISWEAVQALNIGSIGAMPPYALAMFESLKKAFGIKSFLDVWPQLALYRLFGFARGPYLQRLREAFTEAVVFWETYAASEGTFGLQRNKDELALQFLPYDSFCAFQDEAGRLLLAEDLSVGCDYGLVVTTPSGCLSYAMGDRVRIVQLQPLRFVFAERADESLRVGTAIMSLSDFSSWIREVAARLGQDLGAFIVGPNRGQSGHSFVIESRSPLTEAMGQAFQKELDAAMQRDNSYYRQQRTSGYLQAPEIVPVQLGVLDRLLIRPETVGQGKYRRVSQDREAIERLLQALPS